HESGRKAGRRERIATYPGAARSVGTHRVRRRVPLFTAGWMVQSALHRLAAPLRLETISLCFTAPDNRDGEGGLLLCRRRTLAGVPGSERNTSFASRCRHNPHH